MRFMIYQEKNMDVCQRELVPCYTGGCTERDSTGIVINT